jgi:hypothetical protein
MAHISSNHHLYGIQNLLIQQQIHCKSNAEAIDFAWHMREPAFVRACAQIDMNPGNLLVHKFTKETGCIYMITAAISPALNQVGRFAFQASDKLIANRKWPHPFAAFATGSF